MTPNSAFYCPSQLGVVEAVFHTWDHPKLIPEYPLGLQHSALPENYCKGRSSGTLSASFWDMVRTRRNRNRCARRMERSAADGLHSAWRVV